MITLCIPIGWVLDPNNDLSDVTAWIYWLYTLIFFSLEGPFAAGSPMVAHLFGITVVPYYLATMWQWIWDMIMGVTTADYWNWLEFANVMILLIAQV